MEETREGIARQNVIREYMIACAESFKESTVLSAWERSGIRPFNPNIFGEGDYGPSYSLSVNPPLPDSFPAPDTATDSSGLDTWTFEDNIDKEPDNDSNVESVHSSDSESDNEELEVVLSDVPNHDSAVELLNRGDQPDLPILVQSTNRVPTPMRLEHLFLNATPTTCEGFCEEGRESPACLGDREYSTVPFCHPSPPIHVNNHQTWSMLQLSLTAVAPTSAEKLTESEQRVQELQAQLNAAQAEIDTLQTHCYFSSGVISCQQKQLYSRDAKKRGSGCAKKINVKARVLTSQEGCQELQQLCEDAQLNEQHHQQDLAQKAVGDEA
jgi:hypothetical protein